ncbi:MAG: methylmalonyl-CoA mutase, partial [Thermoproteota archaeon]
FRVDPRVEEKQLKRLREVKEKRDKKAVQKALQQLKKAAEKGENIVPAVIDAVKVYCTIGEISDVLREVYGEYSPPPLL